MKRTGPTNFQLNNLIKELRIKSKEANLWKRVANDLEKPTRQRRIVNLSKIDRCTKENEVIVIPGKVLGSGLLNHKLTIAAYSFSESALDKLKKIDAKALLIEDFVKESIKGKKVRIIG